MSTNPNLALGVGVLAGLAALTGTLIFVASDVKAAGRRITHPEEKVAAAPAAAVADHAEAPYCTPQFKEVLKRVVDACGLVGEGDRRGCAPVDVNSFASISDADFLALFTPLEKRGAIVMFDDAQDALDDGAKKIVQEKWEDRRGAQFFFVVARASKPGGKDFNKALSQRRANSVKFLLQEQSKDPDLDRKVGLLWLGSEYAQLPKDYCGTWENSRKGKTCNQEAINRSAFVSWVDCRL
jgi:outer membrane protein OmpA-like peptidoglycan-associated protein